MNHKLLELSAQAPKESAALTSWISMYVHKAES